MRTAAKVQRNSGQPPADTWYRINISGPSFHYRWTYGSGPDGAFSHVIGEHSSHAVCREEPSLTMSWGMEVYDRDDRKDLHFEWAKQFVNPTVRPIWVDFFWNLSLIHISEPTRRTPISYAVFCLKKKKKNPIRDNK